MTSAGTDSKSVRFAITTFALRPCSNCRRTPYQTMRSGVTLHQWDYRGQAVLKLSGGDAARIAIGVRTYSVPESQMLDI
jgi:hypothetical protein